MRHTVALSDIHLSEVDPGAGLWMRYRQQAFSPDGEIAAMLESLQTKIGSDELTLVLNGDIFDFDAPRVVGRKSVFHDQPRTAENAVPMIEAILRDHPIFVGALGRALAAGHTVVIVSGNHDVQLRLAEVRAVVSRHILDAAVAAAGEQTAGAPMRERLEERLVFRSWFHLSPDGILFEHGNQYESYNSYRYPMAPFGSDARVIPPTMGSLTSRHLLSRMGYFNPHVERSFMLSTLGYLAHWARYYLFSTHSLAVAWATGALRTVVRLVRGRQPASRARSRANVAAAARETGASVRAIVRHTKLFEPPSEDRLARVIRELWLDRVGLVLASVVVGLLWLWLAPGPLLVGLLVCPAALAVYELAVPKLSLQDNWQRVSRAARAVAGVHRARAIVFGHTHMPEGAWENGVFYGNTGSWSAAYRDLACTKPLTDERPLVWLTSNEQGELCGGLVAWKAGRFVPWQQSPATGAGEHAGEVAPIADPRTRRPAT